MTQIITLANKRWLTGMNWRSYDDIPDKHELRADAKPLNAPWAAIRISDAATQAGFCKQIEGIKTPGQLFSLAAFLAGAHAQPWAGVFKIREGLWWYIAVRDGHAILPDGDIIGSEETIQEAKAKHARYGDWHYLEGDTTLLADLIDSAKQKPIRIKSLSGNGIQIVPLSIAIVLAACIGGAYYYWQEKEKQTQLAYARAQVLAQIQGQAKNSIPANIHLISKPSPNHWLTACHQAMASLPLSLHGWEIAQVECDLNNATIKWERKWGATVAKRPEGSVANGGDTVYQTIPLQLTLESKDDAIDLPKAILAIQAWTQAIAAPLKIDPIQTQESQNAISPFLSEVALVMELPISPFKLNLHDIPGLRLTQIASTPTGWTLKGSLYGR